MGHDVHGPHVPVRAAAHRLRPVRLDAALRAQEDQGHRDGVDPWRHDGRYEARRLEKMDTNDGTTERATHTVCNSLEKLTQVGAMRLIPAAGCLGGMSMRTDDDASLL